MRVAGSGAPKKKRTRKVVAAIQLPSEDSSVTVRKISNGFLSEKSGRDSKGNYRTECTYHPTNPLEPPKKARGK